MPKVKFKARTTDEIESLDIENGSVIYNTENGKTYLDYNDERIPTGGGAGGGVATGDTPPENPEENDLWVDTNDEEHLAEVDDEVSTTSTNAVQNQAITNYVDNVAKGTILWTNPNPSNDFPAQTLSLDLSNFDVIEIYYAGWNGAGDITSSKYIKGKSGYLQSCYVYSDSNIRLSTRKISSITDNGIAFSTAKKISAFNAASSNDAECVPLYIVGYKTGLFI